MEHVVISSPRPRSHMVFALVSTATVLALGLVAYVIHIWRNTAS